mgnify:CR=1 FL=1
MKLSAVFVFPSSSSNFQNLLTFSPSLDIHEYPSTMTSADFWQFSHTSLHGLLFQNSFPQHICQTSPGKNDNLPLIHLPGLLYRVRIVLDFVLFSKLVHPYQPYTWFLFIRPRFCLRLPSDSTSQWTPLPLASGSHYQAHSGLSPPSYRPCWAHKRKGLFLTAKNKPLIE